MNATIEIPADGRLFEGHFPGRPILPGIGELALVARALAPAGASSNVASIPFARFRELVRPGETLEITAVSRGPGSVRFELKRGGGLVANGALSFGAPHEPAMGRTAIASRAARGSPPLDTLIPHRPPMRFVEQILGEADDGASCLCRIPPDCAWVAGGATPAFVALEAAAQTAAVWEALRRSRESGPGRARIGYLVSVKDVVLHRTTIPAGCDMMASVRIEAAAPPLTTYAAEIVVDGELALSGRMGTYVSD